MSETIFTLTITKNSKGEISSHSDYNMDMTETLIALKEMNRLTQELLTINEDD
jgi:hypothetical protein